MEVGKYCSALEPAYPLALPSPRKGSHGIDAQKKERIVEKIGPKFLQRSVCFFLGLEGIPLFDIHEWGQSGRGQQETDFDGGCASMPPSSSGSGHLSFKEAAGIRLPLGVGYYERKLIMDYH